MNREWKSVCTEGYIKPSPKRALALAMVGLCFVLILITLKVFSHSYCGRGQLALHAVPSSVDHIPDTYKPSAMGSTFQLWITQKISRVVWSILAVFAFMLTPCSMQNITSLQWFTCLLIGLPFEQNFWKCNWQPECPPFQLLECCLPSVIHL